MDNINDVEFEEVNYDDNTEDKEINGSNQLYYNTSQVAQILNIPDSKVRYYTKVFDDILKVEIINKQRKYKQSDIDKLKYMCELKNEGMSIKQIEQFCREVDFNKGEVVVKESNPLSIQALAQAMMVEQMKLIDDMKLEILSELKSFMIEQSQNQITDLEKIKEDLCTTIDENVSEKLGDVNNNIKSMGDAISKTVDKTMSDKLDSFNDDIKEIKEQVRFATVTKEEFKEMNEKKSWFSTLFG